MGEAEMGYGEVEKWAKEIQTELLSEWSNSYYV
jgi:hypothetical protein